MARSTLSKVYNIVFIIVILLLFIPQTRQPIQVVFNKLIVMLVSPSIITDDERKVISSYDWSLKPLSGDTYDFNSAKGKVVIINFWATWCPPCIAEMPSLEELYQKYKANDELVFLFISNEETPVIERFISKNNYSFNVYQPLSQYPQEFDVTSIPRTFVIDTQGKIVIDKSGAADWNSQQVINTIDELLKAF